MLECGALVSLWLLKVTMFKAILGNSASLGNADCSDFVTLGSVVLGD